MRLYIQDSRHEYWNGRGWSSEYPDAQLYPTRGAAYRALLKAREKSGDLATNLRIVDPEEETPCPR